MLMPAAKVSVANTTFSTPACSIRTQGGEGLGTSLSIVLHEVKLMAVLQQYLLSWLSIGMQGCS